MTTSRTAIQVPEGGLRRSLSHRRMTMVAMVSALGTGLFLGSSTAISVAGPAVIVCYAIGALLAVVVGLALGEMTSAHPVEGAFGALARMYLGPTAGFVSRWAYWAAAVVAIGGEVVAAATYLRFWWPELPLAVGIGLLAATVLGVDLSSVRVFSATETYLSAVKVVALAAFILVGGLLILVGTPTSPAVGFANLTADGGFFPNGYVSVWLAMAVVVFAFVGVEVIGITAAEALEPQRSVRTAVRSLVWRLAFFHVAAITVIVTLVPRRQAAAADGDVLTSPFVRVFTDIGLPAAAAVTNVVVLIAALSAANANLYGVHPAAVLPRPRSARTAPEGRAQPPGRAVGGRPRLRLRPAGGRGPGGLGRRRPVPRPRPAGDVRRPRGLAVDPGLLRVAPPALDRDAARAGAPAPAGGHRVRRARHAHRGGGPGHGPGRPGDPPGCSRRDRVRGGPPGRPRRDRAPSGPRRRLSAAARGVFDSGAGRAAGGR